MVAVSCAVYAILFVNLLVYVGAKEDNTESCSEQYDRGVQTYLENNYGECIKNFERSIESYKNYWKTLQNCRFKCRDETDTSKPLYPIDIENLLFYEKTVRFTLCLVKCREDHKDIFSNCYIDKKSEELFEELKAYEYLHICYFQMKQFQNAASAAFTFLVAHPDDKIMAANLKHYSAMKDVDMTEIVNFEAKDYVYLYVHGADSYDNKEWDSAIQNMEESLIAYLQSEDECRSHCEGPFDHGWSPDFVPSVANHFTFCLRCKHSCRKKLSSLNGEKHEDLLPSHYNYLQYSYFKNGDLKAACAAMSSFLLFYPDDADMITNMKYYKSLPKATDDYFQPRPEAVHYIQRQMYENRLLRFVTENFAKKTSKTHELNELSNAV